MVSFSKSFRPHYGPLQSTQPLPEVSTSCLLGVKAAGAEGWQLNHLHVSIVLKSGSLKLMDPSGPVRPCTLYLLDVAASVVLCLACWPLVPKIAGSSWAEAVGFFGRKHPQHAFLRRGSKAVCPMSQICGMLKNPAVYRGSRNLKAKFLGHFSPASLLH
jgi:hypothetical protein